MSFLKFTAWNYICLEKIVSFYWEIFTALFFFFFFAFFLILAFALYGTKNQLIYQRNAISSSEIFVREKSPLILHRIYRVVLNIRFIHRVYCARLKKIKKSFSGGLKKKKIFLHAFLYLLRVLIPSNVIIRS